jgi:hypothetical protein
MRRIWGALSLGSAIGCVGIMALADTPDAGRSTPRGRLERAGDAGPDASSSPGFAPDPTGLTTKHQWILDLRYANGEPSFHGARRIELARPTPTPRMMGRFAVELYVGHELIDRVRFNFPLLGADDFAGTKRPFDAPPNIERGLSTNIALMVPHSERATSAVLVDRATGNKLELPWPFDAADAGLSGDGGAASSDAAGSRGN